MVLVVLGLLLVLTYLLLRGSTPDAALHERRLRAIDALALNQAALHRDVLQASHGLLLNYDPLVAAASRLREVAEELRGAGAASGPLIDSIAAALDEQEALVEDFKSAHALLRNSRTYFAHLSRSLGTSTSQAGQEVAAVVARLATGMLRFAGGFSDDAATAEVAALLDELSVLAAPATLREDIAALRAHGSLILRTLPTVEELLARLLATRISEQARALQDLFIEEHRRAETLAGISRVLLYLASVLLLIYLSHLYVRLRANARTLKARSDFEHLIAGISAQLIDTPVDRTGHGVRQGLEQLGRHTGVDRVYVILNRANDAMDGGSHSWCREGIDLPGGWPDGALAIGSTWSSQGYERHGCIDVPAVQAMPRGEEKSRLTERGIRSWLCVPLWYAGNRVGLLGLDAVEAEKRWADDDIALLRTIGEIFASALGRDAALTQRREAFDRLAASEARYRAVVDTQTEFIARITPDGRLSFVSDAYCRYYGRSREELLGRRFNEFTLTVPEDRERDEAHMASLTPDSPSHTIELRRRLPDGSIRWVQWADTAVFDAQGRAGRDPVRRPRRDRSRGSRGAVPGGGRDPAGRARDLRRRGSAGLSQSPLPRASDGERSRGPRPRQALRGPAARRPGLRPDPPPRHGRGLRRAPAGDASARPQRARAALGRRSLGARARGQDARWWAGAADQRHHPATLARGRAAPGGETEGGRHAGERRRPRLQQHSGHHLHLDRGGAAASAARQRRAGTAGPGAERRQARPPAGQPRS